MEEIKIERYEEYVKDFKEKCICKDMFAYSREELEQIVKENWDKRKMPYFEEMEQFTITLKKENSVDNKEHYFCFSCKTGKNGTAVLEYQPGNEHAYCAGKCGARRSEKRT